MNIFKPNFFFSNKVEDFTADIGDAGDESKETEEDPNKRAELFEVPAQPGVDRRDILQDSKQVIFSFLLSALKFSKKCYVYMKRQYSERFIFNASRVVTQVLKRYKRRPALYF